MIHIRWQALIAVLGIAFLGTLLGYLAFSISTVEQPDYGGTYVEGVAGQPNAVNPLFDQYNAPDRDLAALVFNGLTRVDENGAITGHDDFIKQIRPLPANISGTLAITDYQPRFDGDTALVLHKDDERETYHGIALRARYIMTETWLCRAGQWKLALLHVYVERKDPPAIALSSATLDEYAGRYSAAPDLNLAMRRDRDHLVLQRDGKPAQILEAELHDVFFAPGQPRDKNLFQRDANNHVTRFIDRREGEDIVWTRQR